MAIGVLQGQSLFVNPLAETADDLAAGGGCIWGRVLGELVWHLSFAKKMGRRLPLSCSCAWEGELASPGMAGWFPWTRAETAEAEGLAMSLTPTMAS